MNINLIYSVVRILFIIKGVYYNIYHILLTEEDLPDFSWLQIGQRNHNTRITLTVHAQLDSLIRAIVM